MGNYKAQITKEDKIAFIKEYRAIFKFINKSLSNVVLEYQLKDLLLITKKFTREDEFDRFVAESIRLQLVKKEELGEREVLVLRSFTIKNISEKSQYSYSEKDAKTSYCKMFFILEVVKSKDINVVQTFSGISRIYNEFSTFNLEKSKTLELYKKLESEKLLNINGEIRLNDLELYEKSKLFNLKSSKNAKNKTAIDVIKEDIALFETIKAKKDEIDGNKNFHIYNLAKVSDNKSYFLFFNIHNKNSYTRLADNSINIVKFDVSENFKTSEIGDYIAKVIESSRSHINETHKKINIDIYYMGKKEKESTFIHAINHKIARNGVKNLDSNLTSRIKEVSRRVYQTRLISFSHPKIDYNNFTVSYNVYFNSKNSGVDDFYTLTLRFKNVNFYDDIYDENYKKQKEIEKERKRKEKEVEKYVNDEEFMSLLFEYLSSRKKQYTRKK